MLRHLGKPSQRKQIAGQLFLSMVLCMMANDHFIHGGYSRRVWLFAIWGHYSSTGVQLFEQCSEATKKTWGLGEFLFNKGPHVCVLS